jgi:hypothetical protein
MWFRSFYEAQRVTVSFRRRLGCCDTPLGFRFCTKRVANTPAPAIAAARRNGFGMALPMGPARRRVSQLAASSRNMRDPG